MVFPPFTLGKDKLRSSVLMAPMVGYTSSAFRRLALRYGCTLAAGEMEAAEYLVRAGPAQVSKIRLRDEEHPTALQVVGARSRAMADAARILEDLGADVLDINMGCPARKILKNGAGAALMNDPERAARIVRAVRRAVKVPVTVKIRVRSDAGTGGFVRMLEEEGADAVTVHARAAASRHRGAPRLDALTEAVESVRIPVIGNGGVKTPEDAAEMMRRTGCAGVMVGRAAIGDATLFARIARYLHAGELVDPPSPARRMEILAEHLEYLVEEKGAADAVILFRKCLPHYLRDVTGAREARGRLGTAGTVEQILTEASRVLAAG